MPADVEDFTERLAGLMAAADEPPPMPREWVRPLRLDLCPGCVAVVNAPDLETEIPHGYRSEYICDDCGHKWFTWWLVEWPDNLPYIGDEGALL